MKKVSVIVPTYKDSDDLVKCLGSLEAQSYPRDYIEIIVVDNDVDSGLELSGYNVKLLKEPKAGSYAARNKGVVESSGEVLAFTDADCVVDPDWVKNAVEFLLKYNVDRVAGKVSVFVSAEKASISELYEKAVAFNQERNAKEGLSVTANLITYRSVLEKVGYFDSELFSGGDTEWNRRATALGMTIMYSSECTVNHPARANITALEKKAKRVAGGLVANSDNLFKKMVRLALPPLKLYLVVFRNNDLTGSQKIKVLALATYLKVYTFISALKVVLGIEQAARS